jgi:SET domain-containing protein
MNHSDEPNVIEGDLDREENIAACDIEVGEELTCDYYAFDLDAQRKLSGVLDPE